MVFIRRLRYVHYTVHGKGAIVKQWKLEMDAGFLEKLGKEIKLSGYGPISLHHFLATARTAGICWRRMLAP